MGDGWRVLGLLLHKSYIIRKRHWLGTIVEAITPGCIFAIIMSLRILLPGVTVAVDTDTIYPVRNRTSLQSYFIPSLLRVLYVPENEFTSRIMVNATECLGLTSYQLYGYDNEAAMLASYEALQAANLIISVLAVAFDGTDGETIPTNLVYTMKSSLRVRNSLLNADYGGPSGLANTLITQIPFVALQMCVDDSFINEVASNSTAAQASERSLQQMPYPPYETTDFSELFFRDTIGNWAAIMFVVTFFIVPSYIITEKETGVNALLKINGVKVYPNFLSWLINGIVLGSVTVAIITVILKIYFSANQLPFYYYSNGFILWLALFINFVHSYAFSLHLASYFNKARLAQWASIMVVYIILQVVRQLESNENYNALPYLGFIFPNAAAMRLFDEFNDKENLLTGVQWSNIFTTEHEVLGFDGTLGFIMISSIVAIIFHFFAALYFEAILPGKYNVQKSPLFFLKGFRKNKVSNNNNTLDTQGPNGQPEILEHVANSAMTPGIQIRNLEKTYTIGLFNKRKVEAVRGITVEFYKGEITALLGHNGAGKTTTISILTGLTSPTSGTVFINGKDVSSDMQDIRRDLGMCPQENLMFRDLTVLEQLQLLGMLKQREKTRQQVIEDVDDLLDKLKLKEKRDVMTKTLSGGQKRRLCLGMALIGDATTIILDEPTSGMDPETSRAIWDIILKYRKQKTIIITTHSMEEADVLGDRIAIMQSGFMRCYGTSMFLKKYYGKNCQEVTLSIEPWCDVGRIQAMIGSEANINTATYGRIVLSIPITDSLPKFLDQVELLKSELGVTGVSVSIITLEEVFLKATKENTSNEAADEELDEVHGENGHVPEGNTNQLNDEVPQYIKLTGSALTKQIIFALMSKKVSYVKNYWGIFMGIVFGTLLAVILLPIFGISTKQFIANNRPLNLTLYPNAEALIYSDDDALANTYKTVVESQGAAGTLIDNDENIINALLERAAAGIVYYRNNIIISAEFNTSDEYISVNGLYAGGATLSAPITVNAISNALLKTFAGDEYSISANIENLPRSLLDYLYDEFSLKTENLLQLMLFIGVFFIVVGLFVIHPLLEATTTIKELQRMTGVSGLLYWGTMFIFDYGVYIVATIVTVIGFIVMDLIFSSSMYYVAEIGILVLLLLLFGVNVLLMAYIASFAKKPLYIILLVFCLVNIVIAQLQVFVNLALEYMGSDGIGFMIQQRIFLLLPHVSFTFAYSKFLEIASNNARCRGLPNTFSQQVACSVQNDPCCGLGCVDGKCTSRIPYFTNFNEDAGLDEFVLYLGLTPIALLVILYLLERRVFGQLKTKLGCNKFTPTAHSGAVDSDVANEKSIVRQGINQREENRSFEDENIFFAYELSKHYGKSEAVKEVSFRVKKNECFGLLGVNGAGKSTTFRMLVGEDVPTRGILLRGHNNIKSNRVQYLSGIGYCPQINTLIPSFNAFEHLSLFARLRGVPECNVASEIQLWIDRLRLNKYAKNASKGYSGGNKRRLNIAIALIASPEMVLLDEPTSGVDPGARRSLWRVLQKCQASGQAIILTSHSMEECEALCNRLLIMVRGQLVCIGASQQLKHRFGAGYNITIKLNPERTEEEFMDIKQKLEDTLDCELRDEHPGYLFYHVTDPKVTWVNMFETINILKSKYSCIEDSTISSSTLEQLFIQFARSSVSISNGVATSNGLSRTEQHYTYL